MLFGSFLAAARPILNKAPRVVSPNAGSLRRTATTPLADRFKDADTFLPLKGTDYVEIYASNAKQSAHWYSTVMGFTPVAYYGLETGSKDRVSYMLEQGKIRLVITSSMGPSEGGGEDEVGDHVKLHGDGVQKVALTVDDATKAFEETVKRGAEGLVQPHTISDSNGEATMSGIKAYGDTVHLFVERNGYSGPFLPGFAAYEQGMGTAYSHLPPVGLMFIDHMVVNTYQGDMDTWVDWYKQVFGFAQLLSFDDKDISTKFTSLQSKVMTNREGTVKFPINEPAEGLKKSQIQEYLDFYRSPGIQHIAVATNDIIATVTAMRDRGCQFLDIPDTYYDTLSERVGVIDEDIALLRKHKLLVDRDDNGYMIQIFTKPVADRPTLFFEVIQRKGALSFGKGNFKALFVSIEEEQQKRGTL